MRPILILSLLLLAGCTAPNEDNDALFGYCPHWVASPGTEMSSLDASLQRVLMPLHNDENGSAVQYEFNGAPLDGYLITLTEITGNGSAQLRAMSHDRDVRLLIRDLREARTMQPVVTLTGADVGAEFEIILSDYTGEVTSDRLRLSLDGDLHLRFEVTYLYRVCGQ